MTRQLRFLIMGALVSGLFVAGCAQANPEGGTVTPDPSSTSGSSATPPVPKLTPTPLQPTKTDLGEVTMTGLVERVDLEGGCTVLRADTNKTYELMGGDPNVVKHGSRVTVTGKIRSDLSTICQMGPVLEVTSSRLA
jgi:3D (Asp-Asp-Asp) domain-containing protein